MLLLHERLIASLDSAPLLTDCEEWEKVTIWYFWDLFERCGAIYDQSLWRVSFIVIKPKERAVFRE